MIDTDGLTLHTGRMSTITVSRTRILRHASAVIELLSMHRCMVAALLAHIEGDLTDGGIAAPQQWAETARAVRAEFDLIGAMRVQDFAVALPAHRARLTSLRELHGQLPRMPERAVSRFRRSREHP